MAQVAERAEDANGNSSDSSDSDWDVVDTSDAAIEVPSYFTCLVCMTTARLPLVAVCGHFFCGRCVRRWTRTQKRCPYCQNAIRKDSLIPIRYEAVQEHCQPQPREIKNATEEAVMPEMGMYLRGKITYPLVPRPRFKPLPPEMLHDVPQVAFQRMFHAPTIFQRVMIVIIMVVLILMFVENFTLG